jgi:rhamnulose-1-phosphate aldolase
MSKATPLQIEAIFAEMGEVGMLLHQMGAAEGGAGNISAGVRDPLEIRHLFPNQEQIQLPDPVPALAGMTFIASGSGCRLRDIQKNPTANLGCILVNEDGETARLFTGDDRRFSRLTSEFNSHLIVHNDQMAGGELKFHAVLHAQPLYVTYLSHIERYQDETYFNLHLMRWEPETILQFPQGIGVLKYKVPGSLAIAEATAGSLRSHVLAVWSHHGVICRSDISLLRTFDLVEYAETAAHYEYLNLVAGEPGSGLSVDELRELCRNLNIQQEVY